MNMYFSSLRKYKEEAINLAILWLLKIDIWNIIMEITKSSATLMKYLITLKTVQNNLEHIGF
jgi:hypothetical protein